MPKLVDPEEKRTELVQAIWRVMATQGVRAATLRRVAEEAGCTTGTLTHYFADRKALLIAALRAAHIQASKRMRHAQKSDMDPSVQLLSVLLESLPLDHARMLEWRVWLAFWSEAMHDTELQAENRKRYKEWRGLLSDLMLPVILTNMKIDDEVDYLLALVDGLGTGLARDERGRRDNRDRVAKCKKTLQRHLMQYDQTSSR